MQRQKYQVTITFENNDYMTTYFNALDTAEIISHYNGYTMEYYNGETYDEYLANYAEENSDINNSIY